MSDQLNRIEEMVANLIKMQATNNTKLEELSEEVNGVKGEVNGLKEELKGAKREVNGLKEEVNGVKEALQNFQAETNLNFRKLSRRIRLIENDLDETMQLVESREHS